GAPRALRRAEPRRGRPGQLCQLLPPGLPSERGAAERRPGYGADGPGQRLLPLARPAPARLREGSAEAAVPTGRGDLRLEGGGGGSAGGPVRPAEPQPGPARSRPGPGSPRGPLAPKSAYHIRLSLMGPACDNQGSVEIGAHRGRNKPRPK